MRFGKKMRIFSLAFSRECADKMRLAGHFIYYWNVDERWTLEIFVWKMRGRVGRDRENRKKLDMNE